MMALNVEKEKAVLQRMAVKDLRGKYADVYGDETRSGNKTWLVRRILWRIQANAEGGLSERARAQAEEIANDADLRFSPPKVSATTERPSGPAHTVSFSSDHRVPLPGTILTRTYKGKSIQVRVLEKGFEFDGEMYRSLSALAKTITGTHINGYQFFKLGKGSEQ